MRRREDFRLTLEHAMTKVETALAGHGLLQLYDAWNLLLSALWSPAWLETSAATKEWVMRRLDAAQGETMARASAAGIPGLYSAALAASGVTWHHLRVIDAFVADVPDPEYHLGRFMDAMGGQIRASAADFRAAPPGDLSADHFFEAISYFGRQNLDPPVLVTRAGAALGGDPVAAAERDLADCLTPGVDAVVVLSAGSTGGLAVVVTREGPAEVTVPSFTPEWLRRAAERLDAGGEHLVGLLDTFWHELAVPVLARVPAEMPRLAWCLTGPWRRLPVTGAVAAGGAASLLRSSVSTVIPDPWALSRVPAERRLAEDPAVLAVVAPNTRLRAGLDDLADMRAELEDGRQVLRVAGSEFTLLGGEVTATDLIGRCHEHDVIELHCHGDALDGHIVPSLLLRDTAIGWEDLAMERFTRPRVALLTACRVARTPDAYSADGHSVAHALFERGVPLVAGSLWDMDAAAGEIFTGAFHRRLAADRTPVPLTIVHESLAELAHNARHPRFWAGVTLIGG